MHKAHVFRLESRSYNHITGGYGLTFRHLLHHYKRHERMWERRRQQAACVRRAVLKCKIKRGGIHGLPFGPKNSEFS